jgi:hypothetical protein
MTTRVKRGLRVPADRITLSATSASTLLLVPSSVRVALINLNWHRAKEEEFATLLLVPSSVPRPVGCNVVNDKWIFKLNSDGSLEWFIARWVLHGFTQRPSVDYDETFSPVVKPVMVSIVLSLAVSCS